MSRKIGSKEFAAMLGISVNALHKRIRKGVLLKHNVQSLKDEHRFYWWYGEDVVWYIRELGIPIPLEYAPAASLSNDMKTAHSIIRRIKNDGWPYDMDNEVFHNLGPEAKQAIRDALNESKK